MLLHGLLVLFLLPRWISGATSGTLPPHTTNLPGQWSKLPNITLNGAQFPRQEGSVVILGDEMYLLGGIMVGDTYPTINTVQKFSLTSKTWSEVAPMPVALNHVNVAVVNDKIYYLGGMAVTAAGGPLFWNASAACAVYDPSIDKWTVLPDMPADRAIGSAATLVVGETIYLPGGLLNTNLTSDEEGTVAMFTSYNVATQKWTILPDLPAPRDHAGKGIYGKTLYILGGRLNGHWNVVDTVFGYDIDTGRWSTQYPPMPTGRGGCSSAMIGSKMFIMGGEGDPYSSTNVWPQVQAYDAVKNSWTNYTNMATPVHGIAAVAYNGSIIIPGGGITIGGDPTQLVQRFRP
jgi:N-acetylneuraminic acid mutarotase